MLESSADTPNTMSMASTLTPKEVAIAMVEHGVIKHKTRYDKVFFKAVSSLLMLLSS